MNKKIFLALGFVSALPCAHQNVLATEVQRNQRVCICHDGYAYLEIGGALNAEPRFREACDLIGQNRTEDAGRTLALLRYELDKIIIPMYGHQIHGRRATPEEIALAQEERQDLDRFFEVFPWLNSGVLE
jgi:hypothetical protein